MNKWDLFYLGFSLLGATGVVLFFIISGFLITGILIDSVNEQSALKKFYIRRALRIFPAYYLGTLIILILYPILSESDPAGTGIIFYLFYIQNWIMVFKENYAIFDNPTYAGFNHYWSLAVEEQFYLIWPITFLFIYRKYSISTCMKIMMTIILLSACLRTYMVSNYFWQMPYTWTMTRIDALLFGALLAVIIKNKKEILVKLGKWSIFNMYMVIFAIILCYTLFLKKYFSFEAGHLVTLPTIFYFFTITYVLNKEEQGGVPVLRNNFLQKTGNISYGLYIIHSPVMQIVAEKVTVLFKSFFLSHLITLVVGGVISYAIAWLSYKFFEKPILRLKDKYAPYSVRQKSLSQ